MRAPALIVAAVLAASTGALAATPAPHAPPPKRINVESLQPKSLAPKIRLHTELVVEVNKYGQVARVRSIKPSHDQGFDSKAYGNALQAFIRTPDGNAISGSYRLTYDYDPKTYRVHRDVALLKAGGVDPNAEGAAIQMMRIAHRNKDRTPPPVATTAATSAPAPAPSVNIKRLPDLPQVMHSPSPAPH